MNDRVRKILGGPATSELNHLLWLDPFLNRGILDRGWNCRDHAVALSALFAAEGMNASVQHGQTCFVQGGTGAGDPPVALDLSDPKGGGHSWSYVEGFGAVDISPRLGERAGGWRPLRHRFGVVGGEWEVHGQPARVVLCETERQYDNAVSIASHLIDESAVVMRVLRTDPFQLRMLTDAAGYVDSPLSIDLRPLAGADYLAKLAAHVDGVMAGRRQSLATVARRKAWRFIAAIDQAEVSGFLDGLESGLRSAG